jgi:hypothetical protein
MSLVEETRNVNGLKEHAAKIAIEGQVCSKGATLCLHALTLVYSHSRTHSDLNRRGSE